MKSPAQLSFLDDISELDEVSDESSSTFADNLTLPVHRWFRYSAGFSAKWVESLIRENDLRTTRVFDPFAGSGTTLLAAEATGVPSWGLDAHPFVSRIASAKLQWRSDPEEFRKVCTRVLREAEKVTPNLDGYPELISRCFEPHALHALDRLRRASQTVLDESPASQLAWLNLVAIIRKVSSAGTAQWQYVLPSKRKKKPLEPFAAYRETSAMIHGDMLLGATLDSPRAQFARADSRTCDPVPDRFASLVITSPPYPNNYDYADATRLEMCFLQEIAGWGELHEKVRKHLIVSCSQHVPEKAVQLPSVLAEPELAPILQELADVCSELASVRQTKGGKKTYHLMVACYFRDLAKTWHALRRVCQTPSKVCFVIGDSAPYGVYVPVVPWLSKLAEAAGFQFVRFEKTRDRNIKWKNRKHRVPLQEGRLWLEG